MSRIIHAIASTATHSVAVIETASSGGRWGQPVRLSTVRMENKNLGELFAHRVLNNPKVEAVETWDCDGAHRGPRSNFGKTLVTLKEELKGHLDGPMVASTEREISRPADLAAYAEPVLAAKPEAKPRPARLVIRHGAHEVANEADGPRGRKQAERALDKAHEQQEHLENFACERGAHAPPRLFRVFPDGEQELYRVPGEGDPQPATLKEAQELEQRNIEAFKAGDAAGQEPLTFAEANARAQYYHDLRERNKALTTQRDQLKEALGNVLADGPAPTVPSRKAPGF